MRVGLLWVGGGRDGRGSDKVYRHMGGASKIEYIFSAIFSCKNG